MVNIVDILKAKSKDEENYLLKDHLKETILRSIQLKNFINQNKSTITYKIFDDSFFENLIIACFLHDLGKINWKFQLELYNKEEKELDHKNRKYKNEELNQLSEFFNGFRDIDVKDHEVISLIYSLIFLENNERDKKIRTAILLHHYNEFYTNIYINIRYIFDVYPDLEKYLKFLINNEENIKVLLSKLLENLLKSITDNFAKNVLEKLKNNINPNRVRDLKECVDNRLDLSTKLKLFAIPDKEEENFYDFFVFLGCLRRCDYSASGNIKIEKIENLGENVYKDLAKKIKESINKRNNNEREGKIKQIWQENVISQYDSNNLILIAPTGSGKTEFALLWAKNRGKKLIYTLPLRVALNDLYWRFGDKEKGYFNGDSLCILHSTSFIEYLKEERDGTELNIGEKQTIAELFSSPLILTTPDQVFLSSLKYYGFDKLVSVYPISSIVIDEIQVYNPEMAAIIIKTLNIIKKVYGSLLVITATFPPYFENFLNESNGFKIVDLENEKDDIKYKIKNYNLQRHKIKLFSSQIFEYKKQENKGEKDKNIKEEKNEEEKEEIKSKNKLNFIESSYEKIEEIIKQNNTKNILIILNNVGKAIIIYKKFEEKIKDLKVEKENLYLLHSRLLEKEKDWRINDKEKGIKGKLEKLNKKRAEGNEIKSEERIVLVATQIVEASVDVDFDILITEISSIDSQIQRWGRIYRNRKTNYSENAPNIFIFTGVDRGTSSIYDKRIIDKTTEKLKNYENQVLDYEKERKIIKEVFDSKIDGSNTLKDVFVKEINKNLEWLEYYSAEKRSEAQRIFRRIGGIQVIVPNLMQKSNDEIEKLLGDIIKDKNNWNLPLDSKEKESIASKVKEKLSKDELRYGVDKWKLLQIMYSYSFNLPIFSFGEDNKNQYKILERYNFKDFFVLKTENLDIEEIKNYGINSIKDIDIDISEIEQFENDNII